MTSSFFYSDENECLSNPCGENAKCSDTVSGYRCSCNNGCSGGKFKMDFYWFPHFRVRFSFFVHLILIKHFIIMFIVWLFKSLDPTQGCVCKNQDACSNIRCGINAECKVDIQTGQGLCVCPRNYPSGDPFRECKY